jgi:hypothetical protein
MPRWMPILGQDNCIRALHHFIDSVNDLTASGHGQRTTGTEIILYVDYDQGWHQCLSLLNVSSMGASGSFCLGR